MKTNFWCVILFLLLFQWYARYAAAPVVDFTLDDWVLLQRAENMSTGWDACQMLLQEPDRPVGAFFLALFFRLFGDNPIPYNILGYAVNSVFMMALVGMAWLLTRNLYAVLVAGTLFSVLPNLTESFNWPTMICYGIGFAAVPASAYYWLRHIRSGSKRDLSASVVCYMIGLGNYELGIGLPAIYLIAMGWNRGWRKGLFAMIPFGVIMLAYLGWRFTKGFGLAPGVLFEPRTPSISAYGLFTNSREIVSWWFGGNMLDAFRNGINGYAQMELWPRRLFFIGNMVAVSLFLGVALRSAKASTGGAEGMFNSVKALVWLLAWVLCTHALSLVSWTAGRLNLIPAVGVTIALAIIIQRFRFAGTGALTAILVFACLFSSQGTAYQWKESGVFNRRLADYLMAHQMDWKGNDVIWFDTRAMRSRVAQGLLEPVGMAPSTWAYYGNAGLIRGFAPSAMMQRIVGVGQPMPGSVLDTEYDARLEGDRLLWHERYDESRPRETPMEKVYRIDCLAVGLGAK